jgi:hypothetical protein
MTATFHKVLSTLQLIQNQCRPDSRGKLSVKKCENLQE